MARAVANAAAVRTSHLAEPVGRRRPRHGRRAHLRRRHRAARRPPRRDRRPRRRQGRRGRHRRRHRGRHPRAVQPHRPHRAVRRRPGRRRRRAGSSSASSDPDPQVAGRGIERLRDAGVDVDVGVDDRRRRPSSSPRTSTTAAPAGPSSCSSWPPPSTAAPRRPTARSRWITGPEARADVHRLRAESDAVLVGAGTVRADDPEPHRPRRRGPATRSGSCSARRRPAPASTRASSCGGDLGDVLDTLGGKGVLQVLVEGGPTVAGAFHRAGLVDRYVALPRPGPARRRRRPPAPRRPRRRHHRRRAGGAASSPSTRLGDDLRLDACAQPSRSPDVHRHRRGARHGASPATAAASGSAARTVLDDVADGRVDRGERLLPHRRRVGRRRAGGRPTPSTRPSTARPSATSRAGDRVNLERPVRLADRLGGHLVQGHVDGVGTVTQPGARTCGSTLPDGLGRYVVEKGSITVDGVSLTVVDADADDGFAVAVIPHTAAVTTLGRRAAGRPGEPRGRRHRQVRRAPAHLEA